MKRVQLLLEAYDEKEIWDIVTGLLKNENIHIEFQNDDIKSILINLGISSGLKGYPYLITAIELCIDNREMLNNVTRNLYPEIARLHCVNEVKVEHAIRHAIQKAWSVDGSVFRRTVFGNTMEQGVKPTNTAFIATIADYIEVRKI